MSIASMRTTQVSGLGPVTVYIARFKCRAGLDPDRAYLFLRGSAHQKVAPGRAHSTRLHCQLFCRPLDLWQCKHGLCDCLFFCMCLFIYLPICLSIYLSVSVYLLICLSVCFYFCMSVSLSIYLPICLFFFIYVCLSIYLSIYLSFVVQI